MGKNKSSAKAANNAKKNKPEKMKETKHRDLVKENKADRTSGMDDYSNGRPIKGDNKGKTKSSSSSSSSGFITILLGLSIIVGMAAIIYTNEDVQMFIVKQTPLGSKPWQTILQHSDNHGDPQAKPEVIPTKDNLEDSQENKNNAKTADNDRDTRSAEKTMHKSDATQSDADDTGTQKTTTQRDSNTDTVSTKQNTDSVTQTGEPKEMKSPESAGSGSTEAEEGEKKKKKSAREDYPKSSITNKADFKIRKKLDAAEDLLEEGNLAKATEKFDAILRDHPTSPRALFGKGQVLDALAEKQRSNTLLEESMGILDKALRLDGTPAELAEKIGRKLADRQGFRGWMSKEAGTWRFLAERFPEKVEFQNQQGVAYLKMGKNEPARAVFQQVLDHHPDNGFALVHLGFILKTNDLNYKEAIPMLQRGIDSGEPGVADARFYTHLGDAYHRMNQTDKAKETYKRGYELGLFLSEYQRSTYNAETPITGRPWWTIEQTTYAHHLKTLENNWKTIREEGMAQLNKQSGAFVSEDENLSDTGDWKQFTLYHRGRKDNAKCQKAPKTCALIEGFPAARDCTRGQVKFSVMHPGVHVWPHTGPTNCRIRAHLGLVIPEGPKIRVANEVRTWKEGKFIIFDDSFEHEVWHNGTELRLVLIVDFWHPEIPEWERRSLSPI